MTHTRTPLHQQVKTKFVEVSREVVEGLEARVRDQERLITALTSFTQGLTPGHLPAADLIRNTLGFEFMPGELQTVNASDLLTLVEAAYLNQALASTEPWAGHKFKEVTRGVWDCDCGASIHGALRAPVRGTPDTKTRGAQADA